MAGHESRLNVLAANLANVQTSGFKRELAAEHEAHMARRLGTVKGVTNTMKVDFSQGNLERTGRDLDFALDGSGFFAIEGKGGELYTRDGSFHLTGEGVLVADDGRPVAWEQQGGFLDATGEPILVRGDGEIRQGQNLIGKLKIVDFKELDQLQRNADGYWVAHEDMEEAIPTANVHQGALETSNANPIEELIAMIALQRSYESVSSTFRGLSDTFQRLTRPF